MTTDRRLLLLKGATFVAAHLFLLTLFPPLTIAMLWLCLILVRMYLGLLVDKLIPRGLIVYLPECARRLLRERSLFDVMCDLWFNQEASLFKVLLKPFFVQVRPDRAAEVLDELTPEMKERILTKGIINVLPDSVKKVLSPEQPLTEEQKLRLGDIQLMRLASETDPAQAERREVAIRKLRAIQRPEITVKRVNLN